MKAALDAARQADVALCRCIFDMVPSRGCIPNGALSRFAFSILSGAIMAIFHEMLPTPNRLLTC